MMTHRSVLQRGARSASSAAGTAQQLTLFYSDCYEVTLPQTNKFPMVKYRQTRERVQQHCDDNMSPNQRLTVDFQPAPFPTLQDISTTHCMEYWSRFSSGELTRDEQRRIGFPWTESLVARTLGSAGGTLQAARNAYTRDGWGGGLGGSGLCAGAGAVARSDYDAGFARCSQALDRPSQSPP